MKLIVITIMTIAFGLFSKFGSEKVKQLLTIENLMLITPLIAMFYCHQTKNEIAASIFWLSFVILMIWRSYQ